MTTRRLRFIATLGSIALLYGACNDSSTPVQSYLFSNPGDVELVCFDGSDRADAEDPVLPLSCCDADTSGEEGLCHDTPLLHALVTQTLRGEAAAVDLTSGKVLDSETRVPGYTFVDVGGYPTALVVPPQQPVSGDSEPGHPIWTYVAGRVANSIRAIATCRFVAGRACGPEKELGPEQFRQRAELVLAAAPGDMLLSPDGRALWVSLPDAGLLARIELSATGATGEEAACGPAQLAPFALTESCALREPSYYPLPEGLDLTPPEPVAESTPYLAACGLNYKLDLAHALRLPISPREKSSGTARPTRMRFLAGVSPLAADAGPDAGASGAPQDLLLVADPSQVVVHVLALDADGVSLRASLPVGAPLRDFAVTPAVPRAAPSSAELVDPDVFAYEEPAPDEQRYLYGIDDRNGSLMAFELLLEANTTALVPLLAAVPARDSTRRSNNHGDRLSFGSEGTSARSVEVVDTRARVLLGGGTDSAFCGQASLSELEQNVKIAEGEAKAAPDDEAAQAKLAEATLLRDTAKNAGAEALRGVFLMVASTTGALSVIDVHDLDLQCRARESCDPENPELQPVKGADSIVGVAVQRHAPRLRGIEAATATVTPASDLVPNVITDVTDAGGPSPEQPDAGLEAGSPVEDGDAEVDAGAPVEDGDAEVDAGAPVEDGDAAVDAGAPAEEGEVAGVPGCPAGYYEASGSPNVCVVANPWRARQQAWQLTYEGVISPQIGYGVFDRIEGTDEALAILLPGGLDLCERGVNAAFGLQVALVSEPTEGAPSSCKGPDSKKPILLDLVEASRDRLVVRSFAEDASEELQRLITSCYPSFVGFEVRLRDQYLVSYSLPSLSHRVKADADGQCVIDETLDERFVSHLSPGVLFTDPYIAFTPRLPARPDSEDAKKDISPVIQVALQGAPLGITLASGEGQSDALPARVRYFSKTGLLFVVDEASQGLTRFQLTPTFQRDEPRFR